MEEKIKKIQREDVQGFLKYLDASKPIVPVILDDSGLPEKEVCEYVRALFSNPEKMGKQCVVSNKCKRFLDGVDKDKVEFINCYLADGIQNTASEKKECTIYIMPDYSSGKQLVVTLFRVFRQYISKKKTGLMEWIRKRKKICAAIGGAGFFRW